MRGSRVVRWGGRLAAIAASICWVSAIGLSDRATALPAKVFMAHLDRIRQNLPAQFVLRLPSRILLEEPADDAFIQGLAVRIATIDSPPQVTVGLFSCADDTQFCRIGTFTAARVTSPTAQQDYRRHVAGAAPIQLTPSIRGYFLDGSAKQPPSLYASVMWQQDTMFYTVSFANPERQNLLYMAVSMANDTPIYATNAALKSVQPKIAP